MAEYIEREAAQGAIMKRKWAIGSDGAMAMEAISTIPVADVAPVRHGHWVNLNGKLVCNLCGVFAKWAALWVWRGFPLTVSISVRPRVRLW